MTPALCHPARSDLFHLTREDTFPQPFGFNEENAKHALGEGR